MLVRQCRRPQAAATPSPLSDSTDARPSSLSCTLVPAPAPPSFPTCGDVNGVACGGAVGTNPQRQRRGEIRSSSRAYMGQSAPKNRHGTVKTHPYHARSNASTHRLARQHMFSCRVLMRLCLNGFVPDQLAIYKYLFIYFLFAFLKERGAVSSKSLIPPHNLGLDNNAYKPASRAHHPSYEIIRVIRARRCRGD
jgi:hypothetical protein